MRLADYLTRVAPRALYYAATRRGWVRPINPLTLTFSVTAACQSRCQTCNIGNVYLANPKLAPYGKAAHEILQARGLWAALRSRIVRGENIAQTFQFT